jgi:hypothetical protein
MRWTAVLLALLLSSALMAQDFRLTDGDRDYWCRYQSQSDGSRYECWIDDRMLGTPNLSRMIPTAGLTQVQEVFRKGARFGKTRTRILHDYTDGGPITGPSLSLDLEEAMSYLILVLDSACDDVMECVEKVRKSCEATNDNVKQLTFDASKSSCEGQCSDGSFVTVVCEDPK